MGLPRSAGDTEDLGQRLFQHAFYIVLSVHCDKQGSREAGGVSITVKMAWWPDEDNHGMDAERKAQNPKHPGQRP